MNVTYLKDRTYAKRKAAKLDEFYPDLGDMLIGALERELSEPLDGVEMDEEQARRVRESF